jgi:hypothetical protein
MQKDKKKFSLRDVICLLKKKSGFSTDKVKRKEREKRSERNFWPEVLGLGLGQAGRQWTMLWRSIKTGMDKKKGFLF